MSDYITQKQLDAALAKQTSKIADIMQGFMIQVDQRFNKVEQDIADLKKSHDRLLNTIDGFIDRIDKYETELAARDAKIDRLERWIQEIAKKTNVPMPH